MFTWEKKRIKEGNMDAAILLEGSSNIAFRHMFSMTYVHVEKKIE